MQNLDVISVNLWQILISLLNLVLLFLLLKKFLYAPVKKILEKREREIEESYHSARKSQEEADESRKMWQEKLSAAEEEAQEILQGATEHARHRGDKMIAEAREKANGLIRLAQSEVALERKKAEEGIKKEIVEVSGALAEKMLEREIRTEDHRNLIDSFLNEIGKKYD